MQGKSAAVSSLPVAAPTAITGRLPWPHAGRVVAGLSLIAWVAILAIILPVIG